jgi:hypothetical protein
MRSNPPRKNWPALHWLALGPPVCNRYDSTALHDIMDTKPNQTTSAQFAVDGKVE